jgi:hypothetical protein
MFLLDTVTVSALRTLGRQDFEHTGVSLLNLWTE